MRAMRPQHKFKLHPDRVRWSEMLNLIEVILQAEFGKLRQIPRQRGRNAPALIAVGIWLERSMIAADIIAAQSCRPALVESPNQLRIHPPIIEGFGWKTRDRVRACLIPSPHCFSLPF